MYRNTEYPRLLNSPALRSDLFDLFVSQNYTQYLRRLNSPAPRTDIFVLPVSQN